MKRSHKHTWVAMAAAALMAGCGGGGGGGGFVPLVLPASAPPAAPPPAQSLAEKCPAFKGRAVAEGAVRVDDAKVVAATGVQPEYCVLTASFQGSSLRFEARLPTSGWNGKLAFIGGGGFDGALPSAADPQFSASIFSERYATIGTNGGYDYPGVRDPATSRRASRPIPRSCSTSRSSRSIARCRRARN